jgi:hypothetical protein
VDLSVCVVSFRPRDHVDGPGRSCASSAAFFCVADLVIFRFPDPSPPLKPNFNPAGRSLVDDKLTAGADVSSTEVVAAGADVSPTVVAKAALFAIPVNFNITSVDFLTGNGMDFLTGGGIGVAGSPAVGESSSNPRLANCFRALVSPRC